MEHTERYQAFLAMEPPKPGTQRWEVHEIIRTASLVDDPRLVSCRLWKGQTKRGYAVFKVKRSPGTKNSLRWPIHRLICEGVHGPPPRPELETAHWCGNPACVEPNHLRWVTRAENTQDRLRHGTWGTKYSEELVRSVRLLLAGGLGDTEVASRLGLSVSYVRQLREQSPAGPWGHLMGECPFCGSPLTQEPGVTGSR